MCPAHWLGTGVFPGRAGGRELPLRERAQTGRGSPSAVSWARRAVPVFLSPCAEDRLGCRSLTQHSAQGQLWCHTHPRPPSCRGGQRLSRTDPGVRERAEPDPKPHVPTVRGCSLSCPPGPQPCSPEAVLRLVGGGWHPAALSGPGPTPGWQAEPVLLRGLAFSSHGAARRLLQPDTPGTKAALRPAMPRAQRAGWPACHCGSRLASCGEEPVPWDWGHPALGPQMPGWGTRGCMAIPHAWQTWLQETMAGPGE